MGIAPEAAGSVSPQDAKVAAALGAIAALLASGEALSGRAVKAALAAAHPRAALEAALARGVEAGRLVAVDGPRNARLYQIAAAASVTVSSVPSVPPPVSQASRVSQGSGPPTEKPTAAGLLTRRELAERMGVVMSAVTKWEQAGLPLAERGRAGKPSLYREEDCRVWLTAREEHAGKQGGLFDLAKDRARRERAQAELLEQTFAIRQGDLLPREEVERLWSNEVAAVRTKLLSWSTTLADQVYRVSATEGLPGIERVIDASVRDVLLELVDPQRDLPDGTPPPEGEQVDAAA